MAEEAQLYLAVVEVFRAEGCEPCWRPEPPPRPIPSANAPSRRELREKA